LIFDRRGSVTAVTGLLIYCCLLLKPKTEYSADNEPLVPSQSSVSSAITHYKTEPEIPKKLCPLDWWKVHSGAHPILAKLATRYLETPATIVPCERIFSKSGLIGNKTRAALSPANVNKLVCLNNWLDL